MEDKIKSILNESSQINAVLYSCANQLSREYALDPDNELFLELTDKLMQARTDLANMEIEIIKMIDAKSSFLKEANNRLAIISAQQEEKYEELHNSEEYGRVA